jgi:hypothetical protein
MITNSSITHLKYKVIEENIDINLLANFHLCLSISSSELSIVVTDQSHGKCLIAEKHCFDPTNTVDGLIHCLEEVYDNHHLLKAGFWGKITVAIVNNKFTFIPNSLLDKDNVRQYLKLHCDLETNDLDKTYYHNSFDAASIFTVSKQLDEWLCSTYPNKTLTFIHQTSAFIEGIYRNSEFNNEKHLFINCEGETLTICLMKNKQLEYCNNFTFNTPQDVVYFTLFVMNELYLNTENIPVTIWGDLTKDSPIFIQLFKYIRNITLGSRPKNLTYGYVFDEIEENTLFNSLNITTCE